MDPNININDPTYVYSNIMPYQFVGGKKPIEKNQGREPIHQKYKATKNTTKDNLKEKQKETINKNQVKTLCKKDTWLQNDNQ